MTDPAPQQLDPLTAGLQLQAAVDQLTQPGNVELQRDIPLPGTDAWQLAVDDREFEQHLQDRAHTAAHAKDWTTWEQTLTELAQLYRRREARTTTAAPVPPLLHQLQDAIPNGGDNSGSSGPSGSARSPLALAALDLVSEIADTVGARRGSTALTDHVRAWAHRVLDDDTQVVAAAEKATSWPDRGREILDPTKRWTTPGACPDCGRTTAYVPNDAGETVRRPTIELNRGKATARCLSCGSRWEGETELRQLAKVLEDRTTPV